MTPMSQVAAEPLTIEVDATRRVSGLLQAPRDAKFGLALAHGAGAGMNHPFMATIAGGLAARGVAVLRYQFPYMEQGGKRTDSPAIAQATVRATVAELRRRLPSATLAAGGKSFGGRMTSQAQAASPLEGVQGLVFFGFPLHAAGQPSDERAAHLHDVRIPMLFLQGSRDALADLTLLEPLVERLGPRATLHVIPEGDHSFHVPARSGKTDAQVLEELADVSSQWIEQLRS